MKSNWIVSLTTLITIAITNVATAATVQWDVGSGGNGHWYEVISTPNGISWYDARDDSDARGGYLATVTSAEENWFVFDLTDSPEYWLQYARAFGPWLGGTDENVEGTWEWITGEPWTWANWAPGEPNNVHNEDYLHFYNLTQGNSTWNDTVNEHPKIPIQGYVVEYETQPNPQAIPEPASFIVWSILGFVALGIYKHRKR